MFRSIATQYTTTLRSITSTCRFPSPKTSSARRTISYHLPDALVAVHPSEKRDESRLLCILPKQEPPVNRKAAKQLYDHAKCIYSTFDACPTKLGDFQFKDILRLLPQGCHIIHNESAVLSARLLVSPQTAPSASFEMLLLSPANDLADPDSLCRTDANGQLWRTMLRNDCIQEGDILTVHSQQLHDSSPSKHSVRVVRVHSPWIEDDENDGVEADVEFITHSTTMKDLLDVFGDTPIPPYFNRDAIASDAERYQTVFAAKFGSVAAPTAGLHFSDAVMQQIQDIHTLSKVTLHVGAGTFKPVNAQGIDQHDMHRETWEITKDALHSLIHSLSNAVPIIPVGTTSVRVLESLYWMGARVIANRDAWNSGQAPPPLALSQWEPAEIIEQYALNSELLPTPARAFEALLWEVYPAALGSFCLRGTTEICISPGYEFRVIDGLVTNFHQSSSTLMYLTSAVLGSDERLLECYAHAIENNYRFLSYGDACYMVVQR